MANEKIIEAGIKVLGLSVVAKTLEGPVQTLNDIWGLCGGDKLHQYRLEKAKLYANKIAENISAIPEDKIQSPPLGIIGPALDASKFYIEEEKIRTMFSNLIAASMNSDFNNEVHHSFVEVIKQLNPHDAKILESLDYDLYPLVDIVIKKPASDGIMVFNGIQTVYRNLYFSNLITENKLNSISIDNLIRLGLIEMTPSGLVNSKLYDCYLKSNTLKTFAKEFPNEFLTFEKKAIQLTNFGEAFKKVCCENFLSENFTIESIPIIIEP